MRRLAFVMLLLGLVAACGAKRPVVHADADFDGKRARQEPAVLILSDGIDVREVVPDLVANFEGQPGRAVQLGRDSLADILAGAGRCKLIVDEFGGYGKSQFNFHRARGAAERDSLLGCLVVSRDEYGIATVTVTAPQRLADMLAAAGAGQLVLIDQLRLGRVATDRGTVVTGPYLSMEATLVGQVMIWSADRRSLVYNGFVTGLKAAKQIDAGTIEELACAFARDLYQALR